MIFVSAFCIACPRLAIVTVVQEEARHPVIPISASLYQNFVERFYLKLETMAKRIKQSLN